MLLALALFLAVALGIGSAQAQTSLTGAGGFKPAAGGASNDCGGTGTIAFDNAWAPIGSNWGWDTGVGTATVTFQAGTISGSNRELLVGIATYQGETVLSVKWNTTEALTKIASSAGAVESNTQNTELWGLKAPTTGSHVITVVFNSIPAFATGVAASYTGVNQTTPIFSSNTGVNNSSAASFSLGTSATGGNNCWLSGVVFTRGGGSLAGAGTTARQNQGDNIASYDSGGAVTAGTPTLAYTSAGTTWPGGITVALAPTP